MSFCIGIKKKKQNKTEACSHALSSSANRPEGGGVMTSRRLPQLPLSETLVGHAVIWLHVPCWQSARLCKDKTDLVTFTPVIFSAFTKYPEK